MSKQIRTQRENLNTDYCIKNMLHNENGCAQITDINIKEYKSADEEDEMEKLVYPLISYFYYPKRENIQAVHKQFQNKNVKLLMDSGVFTFRKKNQDVNIDTYIKFLNANADLISYAVTLDYPHDAKTIIKNTDYIQERLDPRVKLIPVIQTFIFDKDQIEYTLQNWDLICLGTYDGEHKSIMYNKPVQDTLEPIYELNQKYKKKLHGLGRTKTNWLMENPIWSTDSSGWARYIFTGQTMFWNQSINETVAYRKDLKFKAYAHEAYYVKRFNIDPEDYRKMMNSTMTLHSHSYPHNMLCVLGYILQQERVREVNPWYRTFLATSNGSNFAFHNKAADIYFNRNKQYDNCKIVEDHKKNIFIYNKENVLIETTTL